MEGFGPLREGFWRLRGPIFRGFWLLCRALALALPGCSNPYKTLAGVVRNALRSMLAIQRATRKTSKNRARSFLNKGFCQERMKIRSWSAPGPILEGYGRLPGVSWAALGHSWGTLGRCGAPLGRIFGTLGRFLAANCCPRWARAQFFINFGLVHRILNVFFRIVAIWARFGEALVDRTVN